MKTLYLIGGTMGVGKTAVSQQLKIDLPNSVFLDGDWCWDANPFQVTEETKAVPQHTHSMVTDNISFLLNNFLRCSAYENIIFCWVMHEQFIIDSIVERLNTEHCNVKRISLMTDEATLRNRLEADVNAGIRSEDVIERGIARISKYQSLNTIKIDTVNKTIKQVAEEIAQLK